MTRQKSWHSYSIGFIIIAQIIALTGCGTVSVENFDGPRADQLNYSSTIRDITAHVTVVSRPEDSRRYFGANILDRNILPVHVAIDNRNSQTSVLIETSKILLSDINASGQRLPTDPKREGDNTLDDVHKGAGIALLAGVTVAPFGFALVAAPIGLITATMMGSEKDVERHLEAKRLHNKMLSPGASASGFVYFVVSPENAKQGSRLLQIQLQDSNQTDRTYEFRF